MDPSSLDSLFDKLNFDIINEAEDSAPKRSFTAESDNNTYETKDSPRDIDKEITDLENLIKKLQTEIDVMTENTNKQSKEYFKDEREQETKLPPNNTSQSPELNSLDNVRRTFRSLWDDPNSATASDKTELKLISELNEFDGNADLSTDPLIEEESSNDDVHVLTDYIAKQKQVNNCPEMLKVDNIINTPENNDLTGTCNTNKPVSNNSKLGILMRIFSGKENKKQDSKEVSNTTEGHKSDIEIKSSHHNLVTESSKPHTINSKNVIIEQSGNLSSKSQQNLDKLYETNPNVDVPRRLSIINIYIDSPKSDSIQNHPKRKVVLNVTSQKDDHPRPKSITDGNPDERNQDIQDCTDAEKVLKKPCNAKVISPETMDIPEAMKETYGKKTSVIDASVELNPNQLKSSNTKLLDNDLSIEKKNSLCKPNKASLNEINSLNITLNKDPNNINTKTPIEQDTEKTKIDNVSDTYIKSVTQNNLGSKDTANENKNSTNIDNKELYLPNIGSVNSENNYVAPVDTATIPDIVAEKESKPKQEEIPIIASTGKESSKSAEDKQYVNVIAPVLIETEEIAPKPIEPHNESEPKQIKNIINNDNVIDNSEDNVIAPILLQSQDKIESNTIVNEAIEKSTVSCKNNDDISETIVDGNKKAENVNYDNEDLTDEYESITDETDSVKDDGFANEPSVYINNTEITINNGDNYSEVYEDSQDHFHDSKTDINSKETNRKPK